jgi:hypothetical protein
MNTNTHFLKNALRINAIFSSLCAVLILLFSVQIANLMGQFPYSILIALAIGLISFVILILSISENKKLDVKQAKIITFMDLSWVISSIILVILGSQWFTSNGIAIILIVAAIVGLLSLFQYIGLKKAAHLIQSR